MSKIYVVTCLYGGQIRFQKAFGNKDAATLCRVDAENVFGALNVSLREQFAPAQRFIRPDKGSPLTLCRACDIETFLQGQNVGDWEIEGHQHKCSKRPKCWKCDDKRIVPGPNEYEIDSCPVCTGL